MAEGEGEQDGVADLADALTASFKVSKDLNSTDAPHPRLGAFKSKTVSDQASRRLQFLEESKQRRGEYAKQARKLVSGTSMIS